MSDLTITGLGVFLNQLAPEAKASIDCAAFVVFQTRRHPLFEDGRGWTSCDDLYGSCQDFDELNKAVAKRLADLCERGRTVFCMPGTPLGKAMTLEITKVCRARGIPYAILPGTGYADAALASCGLCFEVPAVSMDAIAAEGASIDPEKPLVVCEIDSPLLAGAVKLALLEYYPDDDEVKLYKYWYLRNISSNPRLSYEEVKEEVRRLFFAAVEKRLVADVPFGAFLSGGIDSSAVVGAMSRFSDHKVKTFTITFAEDDYSEAPYCRDE